MTNQPIPKRLIWPFFGAPVVEEAIFRLIPYLIFLRAGESLIIGLISSILFMLIHINFGVSFMLYTLASGFAFWIIMLRFGIGGGIIVCIVLHSALNILDWKFGIRKKLTHGKFAL